MATKTISLQLDAYEKLRAARRYPTEFFSQVVMRASWPEQTVTAGPWLASRRACGPLFSEGELKRIEALKTSLPVPASKWKKR